ncbi:MAG: ATP-dependent RNA/DNA helicase IGHMBP2 [Paraglaciecola sp.]|jgi:ATP-dependent RNA/DNA helicase IGHMBP2
MDFNEHFSKLQSLLKIEREEDRKQFLQKIRNRSVNDRKRDGVCWYPVKVKASRLGVGDKWSLTVERNVADNQRHHFQTGCSVSLFVETASGQLSVSGIVSKLIDNSMTIILNQEEPPDWVDDRKLGVDLLFDESTYDEMDRTLARLKTLKGGRIKELIPVLLGQRIPYREEGYEISLPQLNDSQNAALQGIRSAKDIAIVHGPPGTGKTTTMVHAIVETVAHEKQVLVCAASNAAVDLLVERLHNQSINVLRLGHPARVNEEVVVHSLDVQLSMHADANMLKDLRKKSEEYFALGGKFKRKFGREEAQQRRLMKAEARKLKEDAKALEEYMIQDLLNHAQVIACTLVGSNHRHMHKRTFKTVFIDESSQALEPANWIPIFKADRVIMAGDHLQLPPTVKSKEANKAGLGMTLFERCINSYEDRLMLTTQYRMHDDIQFFSNRYFYQNQLQAADYVKQRRQLFTEAAVFIDTAGAGYMEELNQETLSTYNTEEAAFVIDQLCQVIDQLIDEEHFSIGVIAPYSAQVEKLRAALRKKSLAADVLKKVSIHTVDAFQGQERDVILISLTRSNAEGIVGFLANERRMNVAMTRARHKLIMVGDSSTLATNPFFNELIEYFQQRNQYHSVFEYLY